jgi:indole-3-glycerol phosphate synthase
MDVIEGIVGKTRAELGLRKGRIPLEEFDLSAKSKSLRKSILDKKARGKNAIISEIKPASPSAGRLREVDAAGLAEAMERGGACAISVLTEPFYFFGSLENLQRAKKATRLPVLRKDFIIDEYQLYEAKHYGADAVLLMVAVLGEGLGGFYKKTKELGMEALVEVHNESELEIALDAQAELIGLNNRDLRNLRVDLNTTKKLAGGIPKNKTTVSESGIKTKEDLTFVLNHADAALIGTTLMRAVDVEKAVRGFVE